MIEKLSRGEKRAAAYQEAHDALGSLVATFYLRGKAQGKITMAEAFDRWRKPAMVLTRAPGFPEDAVHAYTWFRVSLNARKKAMSNGK